MDASSGHLARRFAPEEVAACQRPPYEYHLAPEERERSAAKSSATAVAFSA
ncbi:hypothetical protein [Parvularcula maris]|uniref:Uncharacterized protein n=1 Tax=Parvularcula maris TaxID=2965077 RepID=A0A9X2L810_9PROT|nr:hypothetical protein [Parvularcula maris]MCQ8184790.1 hypothetical protein [Parvularcula maris]